jgi:hypothetical protein
VRRGKPLARVSPRRAERARERQQVVDRAFARDRWTCRAEKLVPGIECSAHLDAHERIPRSVWPEGMYELDNILSVCRAHHRWIDRNPDAAHDLGLHGYAHEKDDHDRTPD